MAHPVERVFAFMADVRNRPLWQENTHDVEVLSEGEPGLGTRWRESAKGIGTYEAEVVAFERDELWAEAADLEAGRARGSRSPSPPRTAAGPPAWASPSRSASAGPRAHGARARAHDPPADAERPRPRLEALLAGDG